MRTTLLGGNWESKYDGHQLILKGTLSGLPAEMRFGEPKTIPGPEPEKPHIGLPFENTYLNPKVGFATAGGWLVRNPVWN